MKSCLRIVAAAVACGASLCAVADINAWSALGPNGGAVFQVAFSPTSPATIYAASVAGFVRSLDAGATWQAPQNQFQGPVVGVAVDPTNGNRLYVLMQQQPTLLVSSDGGTTLTAATTFPVGLPYASNLQVSRDGATICVSGGLRVVCSIDHGQSWLERTALATSPAGYISKLLIDPTDALTLYVSACTDVNTYGLYVSHDGGVTWQQLTSTSASAGMETDLAISPAAPNRIYSARGDGVWVSNDRGVHWSAIPYTSPHGVWASVLTVDPTDAGLLYVGSVFGTIFMTPDGGATWFNIGHNGSAAGVNAIALDPVHAGTVLVGGQGGLWESTNSGASWSFQSSGILGANIDGLSADPASDRIYMSLTTGGVYVLANGSSTPTPANLAGLQQLSQVQNVLQLSTVLAQSVGAGRVFAGMSGTFAFSLDGGATWALNPVGAPVDVLASSSATPQVILGVIGMHLLRSTDGGTTWAPSDTGLPAGGVVTHLAFAPSDAQVVYAALQATLSSGEIVSYGVYRSADAGQTWAPANAGIESAAVSSIAVDPVDAQIVYAASMFVFLKSVDGGHSWSQTSFADGAPLVVAADPIHSQIVYSAGVGFAKRSVDGGSSWQALPFAVLPTKLLPSVMLVDSNRPSDVLLGTSYSGVHKITVAPDLALLMTTPSGPIPAGVPATYTYAVINKGPFDATGVQVAIQLPAGAQNIAATFSGGSCVTAGTVATCTLGTYRVGQSTAITLNATAPATGAFQLMGTVHADQPDSDTTNNSVTTVGTVAAAVDLSVTATGTATATVGDSVVYTLTVTNAGPGTAPNVQLGYQLAAGLTAGSVTASSGTCTSGAAALISCSLGDLGAATSASVTVNAKGAAVGTQASTVTVTTSGADTGSGNNSATVSTILSAAPPIGGTGTGTGAGGTGTGGTGAGGTGAGGTGTGTGTGGTGTGGTGAGTGSSDGGSNGGGGGAFTLQWLLALASLLLVSKVVSFALRRDQAATDPGDHEKADQRSEARRSRNARGICWYQSDAGTAER